MKSIKHLFTIALTPVAIMLGSIQSVYALQLTEVKIDRTANTPEVRLNFDTQLSTPKGFMLKNPPRLVLDLPTAKKGYSVARRQRGYGIIKNINVVEASRRVRVIFQLHKPTDYSTRIEGNQLVVSFGNHSRTYQPKALSGLPEVVVKNEDKRPQKEWAENVAAKEYMSNYEVNEVKSLLNNQYQQYKYAPKGRFNQPRVQQALSEPPHQALRPAPSRPLINYQPQYTSRILGNIDFRRDSAGNGRVIIDLPDDEVEIKDSQVANTISLAFKGVDYPRGKRRLDVLDFGTPVNYISILKQGTDSKVRIGVSGKFKYSVKYSKNRKQVVVYVKKILKKPTKADLKKRKKVYTGEKLTLNFQDIEVRSVLQLLADFTNKNIVVSDSVKGNITLRLKNVPWDQALDIVLISKALAMKQNGNVIWVAPEAELAAREQRELDELSKKKKHQTLITEYIAVNFAKATELADMIRSKPGEKSRNLLSKRGTVSVDNRTNTLLIQDTSERVEDIRSLIKILDIPVKQVAIEARIVIADDNFSKDLGSRFGITGLVSFNGKQMTTTSGSANATGGIVSDAASNLSKSGQVFPVSVPGLNDRLNFNLPVAGAAGKVGFSLLSQDFLVDLELSALQAENRGEIISTPRVVTANQSKAMIEQGVEIPYQQASSSGATNVSFKKAVLSLEVTPQITPEEHVIMDLKINQDTVGNVVNNIPSINTREIKTKILVDNGQTIVLGGIHEETSRNGVEKVPFLGDLPIIGRLFKRTSVKNDKRELLIFITPKILD